MAKTLVYCTGFSTSKNIWQRRYRAWLDRLQHSPLKPDQILIVDDGSPVLPAWADLTIIDGQDDADPSTITCNAGALLYHFPTQAGRHDIYDFPGWYRSYTFGALYGAAHGFDKITHLESDAALITPQIHNFFNTFTNGWATLWCQKYQFPEIAIQIAAGQGIAELAEFCRRPYAELIGRNHEEDIPIPWVERRFAGGRFPEAYQDVPRHLDFVTQIHWHRDLVHHWWRPEAALLPTGPDAPNATPNTQKFDFTRAGNTDPYLGAGWSRAEENLRWMTGQESHFTPPHLPPNQRWILMFFLNPYLASEVCDRQHLTVIINDAVLADFELRQAEILTCQLPASLYRGDGTDTLRFIHPDAISPLAATGRGAAREISFAMRWLILAPLAPA